MAWNESGPGGNDRRNDPPSGSNGDPWGKRGRTQGPPDLDEVFAKLKAQLSGLFGGGGSGGSGGGGGSGSVSGISGTGIGLIAAVAAAVWLFTGFYVVEQGERGVILQFGKRSVITEAGWHWRFPFPFEKVEKVNVEQVSNLFIGYRPTGKGSDAAKVPKEALMLTEDENIVDVEFAIQYKVKDASDYIFNMRDPQLTIVQATESAVREIVGKSPFDFVITGGRDEIATKTQALLQEILDRYKAGIHIVTVQMQKAGPPEEVKAAFDDAVKAREDEQRLKNEAEAYSNDVIPRARGSAARMVLEAEGYRASVIARADGDARRFSQIVVEYARAPGVTRDRLYLETMEKVLSKTTKIFIDQKAGNNLLYLPLDRLLSHSNAAAGPVSDLQPLPEMHRGSGGIDPPAAFGRDRSRSRE